MTFIGNFGLEFKDQNEFKLRQALWKTTDDLINARHDTAYKLKHNKFSVMTQEEKAQILSLKMPNQSGDYATGRRQNGRRNLAGASSLEEALQGGRGKPETMEEAL